jgi:hypothetical protein
MMSEGEVRQLLRVLKSNLDQESNVARIAAWSGGISALEMVLGDNGAP